MVVINYDEQGTALTLLATLEVNNITNLPNDYKYKFNSAISLYQDGIISNNTNRGELYCSKPNAVRIYESGVYIGLNITPTNYIGFGQQTKYVIFDNVSVYPDPQNYEVEIWMGGFQFEYAPLVAGYYEFYAQVDYKFYCDNAYNGQSFNVSLLNYGVKSNPLVSTSQMLNATYQSGSINETGFINANSYLTWTKQQPVSAYTFIGPTLYAKVANTWSFQLLYQQYLNISVNDPIQYYAFPYKFKIAYWVMVFDNTSLTPSSITIRIFMKKKATPAVISAQGEATLTNFAFQNNSIIVQTVSSSEIPLNVPVQFYVNFYDANNNPYNFGSEFIIYPYVYQLIN